MPGAYYEENLPGSAKDLHRAILSLEEELEAVNAYNQRMNVAEDPELRAVLEHNRNEEIEHAAMLQEWLRRQVPEFDNELKTYLFKKGSIAGAEAEATGGQVPASGASEAGGSLNLGKL